jgi:Heavy metal associated domain 2
MLYIHHVPGRLRLQMSRLKSNHSLAEATRRNVSIIADILDARVSTVTGSLIITYDKQRLTPAALWQSLCDRGIVWGPLPIRDDVPVTRVRIESPVAADDMGLDKLVIRLVVERLLERSAIALVGALT